MPLHTSLDHLHTRVRANGWFWWFTLANRLLLALGFLPAGWVKVTGERFTDLHNLHPMGAYLEALHHTGYYYPFIGWLQILAALLLLIPVRPCSGR